MLSLVRIPFVLIATVGLHVSTTPPNPPPTDGERASTTLEALLRHPLLTLALKGVWSATLPEIIVILANYTPSSTISQSILSNLIFAGRSAEHIHTSPLFFVGCLCATIGGWIRYNCYKALGTIVVRHPGHTGTVMAFIGMLLIHGTEGSWLRESGALENPSLKSFTVAHVGLHFIVILGLLQRMLKEDENLHQRYGKEWENWASRVPTRLIPWLF